MTTTTSSAADTAVTDVAVELLDRDPNNRAAVIDRAFAKSIAAHGVLIPVLITPAGNGRYRLIAGERRVQAARLAGHATVPVVVRDIDDTTAAVHQAVENLQRRDLTPAEEAVACARLLSAGMTRKHLATELGRPASWVKTRLAIAGLPTAIQQAINCGELEPSDAVTLAPHAADDDLLDAIVNGARRGGDLEWFISRHLADRAHNTEIDAAIAALAETGIEPVERAALPKQARTLRDLGLDPDAHRGEPCHAVTVAADWNNRRTITVHCTDPKRHRTSGVSGTDSETLTAEDERRVTERAQRRLERDARAHLDAFALDAINTRLRSRDVNDFILPILFDHLGMTELGDAAKLLGHIEAVTSGHSAHKDYATPLRAWARRTPANLTRTLLAVAYVLGRDTTRYGWGRDTTRTVYQGWLDRLGYQPEPTD